MRPTARLTIHNQCTIEKVDPAYQTVIAEVITVYRDIWPDRIIAVHLLGSVARGEAMSRQSDIDFLGLVDGDPSPDALEELDECAAALASRHSIVSRVDLEAIPEADPPAFRRFVLASDSICVYGEDRYTKPVQTINRMTLAELVTPNVASLMEGYRLGIAEIEEGNEDAALFWSRIVGKDLLKCLRSVILLLGGDYEQSIAGIHRQVAVFAPGASDLADLLFALYREPTTDLGRLHRALDMAEAILPGGAGPKQ